MGARRAHFAYAARVTWPRRSFPLAVCATLSLGACERGDGRPTGGDPAPSALASSAATPAAATTRAVVTMDAAHDVMSKKDALAYTIAPSTELVIEIGDHPFRTPDAAAIGAPDTVHVARGSSGYYRATFSGKRIALNAASLDPLKGREAFPGFEAGESYVVAVGVEASSAPDGAMRFTPLWTTKVNVVSR